MEIGAYKLGYKSRHPCSTTRNPALTLAEGESRHLLGWAKVCGGRNKGRHLVHCLTGETQKC